MRVRAVLALCLVAAAAPGSAATITGQITDRAGGAPLANIEVRLYTLSAKGWVITTQVMTNGSGDYAFFGVAGDYLLQAVPPNLFGLCYARRYYDVAAPSTGGTVESTADVITVAGATVVTADIGLDLVGAIDGRVTQGGVGLNGTLVRVERIADTRIHFFNFTFISAGTPGTFALCGVDPGTHRIWIHHPAALYEDLIAPGPYTVTSGTRLNVGSLAVVAIGNDPYEPNPAPASGTPLPAVVNAWESSGAILTPRGSDVDFYCLDALAGDRYVITSTTTSTVAGQERPSPWVDPMLGWFSASPVQLLLANDDDPTAPGSLNARIDTGVVPANARYCVGVTSYNDPDFNGSEQFSAGRYAVRIASDAMFANGFEGLP